MLNGVGIALVFGDRPGSRANDRVIDRLFEALLGVAVVGHHLGRPEVVNADLRATRDDIDVLWRHALDALDLVDIAADLDESAGLGAAGELGVGDFVVVVLAKLSGPADPEQEVRMANPSTVEDRRLEN